MSCNIKIIDEKKKFAGQNEKIFIFAASKNPSYEGRKVLLLRRQADTEGRGEIAQLVRAHDS